MLPSIFAKSYLRYDEECSSGHVVSAKAELFKTSLFSDLLCGGGSVARTRVIDIVARTALSWSCKVCRTYGLQYPVAVAVTGFLRFRDCPIEVGAGTAGK